MSFYERAKFGLGNTRRQREFEENNDKGVLIFKKMWHKRREIYKIMRSLVTFFTSYSLDEWVGNGEMC
jgi:hypothetical protein